MRLKRGNKFHAKKVQDNNGNLVADSKDERECHKFLNLKQLANEISKVEKWPTVELTPYIKWKIDFSYIEDGQKIFCEFKGCEGERFRLLCQLWKTHGPGPLEIIKKSIGGKFIKKRIYPDSWKVAA